jgi:flagellar basal body-associated protein FliL
MSATSRSGIEITKVTLVLVRTRTIVFGSTSSRVAHEETASSGVNVDTVVWIVIAVVVVLALIALALLVARKNKERRRVQAGEIREQASERVAGVRKREAIAEEHAANARRAQAEADAKAAEAKRLAAEAQTHQGTAATKRQELDAEFQRADKLDPDVGKDGQNVRRHENTNTNTNTVDPRQPGNGPANANENGSHVPRHNR